MPPLQNIDYTSCSYKDIFNLFPDLTFLNTFIINKKHPCEAEGPPVAFRPRRLSLEKANALDVILDDLLERKIIRPSCSPWASPVHLVKKKDGAFHLVHDYRVLNSRTKKQNYPLPRISDLTQQIRGVTIFSSLDLKNAF